MSEEYNIVNRRAGIEKLGDRIRNVPAIPSMPPAGLSGLQLRPALLDSVKAAGAS
jgi:hypothetical protein